jgi:hypothetical protein
MAKEMSNGQSSWTPPYAASWVDRLQDWLANRRLPIWAIYPLAWLAVWALVSGPALLGGTRIPALALRVHAGFSANTVLFLAAMQYLDHAAHNAIRAFRPAMRADEASFRDLEYTLTTMPARPALLIGLLGGALPLALSPVSVPAMRQFYFAESLPSILIDIGLASTIQSATFAVFVFHTVRQLRVVSRIHRQHALVSLFRLRWLYGLSSLTARSALTLMVIGSVGYATVVPLGSSPRLPTLSSSAALPDPVATGVGYLILSTGMATAVFASPLIGLHRMLVREKSRLQAENDQRLELMTGELHRLVDDGDLERISKLNTAISGLVTEREVIRKTPTWPWSPGAFGVLTSAVLLPIVVWLLQQLLERVLSP